MARIVPKRTLDDVRFRSDIVDVIGAALPLKRAGANFKACCPFHKEKTPSFHVNPARQIFHCFGCGKGGDVFSFVMEHEGVDFMTAVQMLADRANIPLELEGDDGAARSHKDTLLKIHEEIAAFYQRCLDQIQSATAARDTLQRRGLDSEEAGGFGIGYAPDRWDAALQWARKHDVSPELMEEAGLIIRREPEDSSAGYYDRFRHRLMFPIRDIQGRVIAFSGRALRAEDRAKYLNSPETPLFRKSRVLYALDMARRQLVHTREAIICEGQIDVIRCHLAGFATAVAAQGTAFTADHANLLQRYVDGVVLVFDSDEAGRNAAIKTAAVFMDAGLGVRVATLPSGQDPDSFIRQEGAEAFGDLLKQASTAVDFQIDILGGREDLRSVVGTMRAARAVVDLVRRSPNAVQQARLLQHAAERLQLPVAALQDEMRHGARRDPHPASPSPPASNDPETAPPPPAEQGLCEYLANPATARWTLDITQRYLPTHMLTDPRCRRLAELAARAINEDAELEQLAAAEDDHSSGLQAFIARIMMQPDKFLTDELDRETPVTQFILRIWKHRLKLEQAQLKATQGDDPALAQITYDLKLLDSWDTGKDVIELRMESD